MRSYLKDKPKILLIFNQNIQLKSICYHNCVDFSRFEEEKTLYFEPPEGEFTLLKYIGDKEDA